MTPGHFRRHRLFWRVYLHSLLVIAVVALFLFVLGWVFNKGAPWDRVPRAVAAQLEAVSPGERGAKLAEMAELTYQELVLYRRDGEVLAEARQANACPLDQVDALSAVAELKPDRSVRVGHGYRAIPVGEDAFLVARWRGHDPRKFVYAVAGLLVILALISWPRARRIARPVEAMVGTVDRVAEGDLEARVGPLRASGDLRRLGGAIDGMLDNLARLRTHEKALLADISHELRTPMARIRVALEWAAEEGDLPEPLQGVDGDLAELEGLVEDVLASARLDPVLGEAVLRREQVAVSDLLASAAHRFARRHPNLALSVPQDADGTLHVDPRFAHRVFDNLLDNAGRYGAGPVQITVEGAGEGAVAFTVRDHGPGVAPDEVAKLFDAFWRAEQSRSKARGGVGLGLTLCQRIVAAHGGSIQATLPEGGGLAVRFTLPVG